MNSVRCWDIGNGRFNEVCLNIDFVDILVPGR
jgi:hypothetical protein